MLVIVQLDIPQSTSFTGGAVFVVFLLSKIINLYIFKKQN
jgi:hypothetical protein